MSGCASLSAAARRWSRPTTSRRTAPSSPSARSRWRASRRKTVRRARRPGRAWRATFPISICSIRSCRASPSSKSAPARAEGAALAVKGVTKSGGASASAGIGGMVLVTSHGFRGAYLGSRHERLDEAIAGEGTGMERDYDFSSARSRRRSRSRREDRAHAPASARSSGSIRARSRPSACRSCSTRASRARWSAISPARSTAARSRARRASCKEQAGRAAVPAGHPHHRRSAAPRGLRSRPFDAEGVAGRRAAVVEDGVLAVLDPRLRDRARARPRRPPATPSAACRRRRPRGRPTCISRPAAIRREELIADIAEGFYVTDLIGMGVNLVTGDYSRGAAGFWIENGELTYPVSEVTIAGHLIDMFRALVPGERSGVPLRHQCADRARGGSDRCRPLTPTARRCAIDLACRRRARGRRAGAARPFAASPRSWIKGDSSPVSEVDIAVDALLRERL